MTNKVLDTKYIAKPFIKWAGGKGQLLPQLHNALPHELSEEEFVYIEPFVGGGAMLFYMLRVFPNIKRVVINDININLTNAYVVVKNDPDSLIRNLNRIEKDYRQLADTDAQKDYYLKMRHCFNTQDLTAVEKTALFIFLNHTCFNGLYRENSKGLFNVPFGRYSNPTICNEELILADSELLNHFDIIILNGDYIQTEKAIDHSLLNFFYFDPPYRPISATSSFNSYVKNGFNDENQQDLACLCHRLSNYDNVKWMLSNSDCSTVNPGDTFFENLFNGFNIQRVYASRAINANASKRGKLTELLICNYNSKVNNYASQHLKIAL